MKRTAKRITSVLLSLALLLSFSVPALAADDYWWTQYVSAPMEDWSIDGVTDGHVTSHGSYVLVTSDTHRYTYLAKDLLAEANEIAAQDGATENIGLVCFGGDFANEYVLYDDNMSILKAALQTSPGTVATYTKGNHEGSVTDEEFIAKTGMSRIGETAVNAEGNYHFFNFGALNKTQQFTDDDIAQLKAYLETPSVTEDGKPIIIVSHYPLHYYNSRRSSKQADQVLELLNNYPQVIFLWGHNHTEQDPNYGMIRVPGDIIQTGATADTSQEIRFTYACLGALRDGINEANGLLMRINDDGTTTFRYIGLHASADDEDSWTDAQGNTNAVRYAANVGVSSDNTYSTPTDESYQTISLANVQIERPLVDKTPAESASEYSPRFSSGAITWNTDSGTVTGTFDFDTVYTASFTLTAEEGYTFAADAVVSVNKEYVGPAPGVENNIADNVTVSADGKTATVVYSFPATTAQGATVSAADTLTENGQYVLAAIDENMAASYLYDPAQHGEESMPDYTAASADVVIREGQLVSATTDSMIFTAQKDADGYLLWSDASLKDGQGATTLNFLSMSTRGGELGLEASESAGMAMYNNWSIENGVPYLNIDGAKCYAAYASGSFCFVTDPAESNVRLFQVGTRADSTVYNISAVVSEPEPGTAASNQAALSAGVTVESVQWDAEVFDYDTAYTATVTAALQEGYTLSEVLTGRVNGNDADVSAQDGKVTLTYTFPATGSAAGLPIGLSAKKAESIQSGHSYIIVSGNTALSASTAQGLYQTGTTVKIQGDQIVSRLTADLVFTATGNDTDGYALGTEDQYLAGRSVDSSPDLWGFTKTDDASSAVTFAYQDGKLQVVSTGASAGGPASTTVSYLYLSNGHFNFGSLQSSEITLYELYLPFTDVAADRWSRDQIYAVAEAGVMLGTDSTVFSPEASMTRAMAATVIYRLAGSPAVEGDVPFEDVGETYYTSAVLWGYQNGIIKGVDGSHFDPDSPVTREQFAAMLSRYMTASGLSVPEGTARTFTDADSISDYARESIDSCVKGGIIQGFPDGSFQPKSSITREQAATMLSRLMDLSK